MALPAWRQESEADIASAFQKDVPETQAHKRSVCNQDGQAYGEKQNCN